MTPDEFARAAYPLLHEGIVLLRAHAGEGPAIERYVATVEKVRAQYRAEKEAPARAPDVYDGPVTAGMRFEYKDNVFVPDGRRGKHGEFLDSEGSGISEANLRGMYRPIPARAPEPSAPPAGVPVCLSTCGRPAWCTTGCARARRSLSPARPLNPPPSDPVTTAPRITAVNLIVNGERVKVGGSMNEPLSAVVDAALLQSKNSGRPASEWELRLGSGVRITDQSRPLAEYQLSESTPLYLTLAVGFGAACPVTVATGGDECTSFVATQVGPMAPFSPCDTCGKMQASHDIDAAQPVPPGPVQVEGRCTGCHCCEVEDCDMPHEKCNASICDGDGSTYADRNTPPAVPRSSARGGDSSEGDAVNKPLSSKLADGSRWPVDMEALGELAHRLRYTTGDYHAAVVVDAYLYLLSAPATTQRQKLRMIRASQPTDGPTKPETGGDR